MGFSSLDDRTNKVTVLGQTQRIRGQRTIVTGATSVAGRWHECFTGAGTGGAGVLTGTAGVGFALSSATTGSIPQKTANVSPATKHLAYGYAVSPATTLSPGLALLTDLLYCYPSCVVTGTPTTLNNGAAKPTRFDNGREVQAAAIVVSVLGATTPSLTMTYTDQSGNTGNTGSFTASANSLPVGSLLSGGAVAQLGGPDMVMAAGDSGVRELNSYTIASGTTGTVSFLLHRPIAEIPIIAANTPAERDFVFQVPTSPKIDDDACLAILVNIGGALVVNQILHYSFVADWG